MGENWRMCHFTNRHSLMEDSVPVYHSATSVIAKKSTSKVDTVTQKRFHHTPAQLCKMLTIFKLLSPYDSTVNL